MPKVPAVSFWICSNPNKKAVTKDKTTSFRKFMTTLGTNGKCVCVFGLGGGARESYDAYH